MITMEELIKYLNEQIEYAKENVEDVYLHQEEAIAIRNIMIKYNREHNNEQM
jgi:hypothetical protein